MFFFLIRFVETTQYKSRTLTVEGPHVERFLLFMKKESEHWKEPDIADTIYLRCKESDPLLIVDQDKKQISHELLSRGDRVLCTFNVQHWVIKKNATEGFKFQLLSVRHLPAPDVQKVDEDIYCGPDFD